jgi:hypothetical protein
LLIRQYGEGGHDSGFTLKLFAIRELIAKEVTE